MKKYLIENVFQAPLAASLKMKYLLSHSVNDDFIKPIPLTLIPKLKKKKTEPLKPFIFKLKVVGVYFVEITSIFFQKYQNIFKQ